MIGLAFGLFFVLFFGIAALFVVLATGTSRMWKSRPKALRAFAERRGFQFVDQPEKPTKLYPIWPVERPGEVKDLDISAAVVGRARDTQFTLFDLFKWILATGSKRNFMSRYETFITFKTDGLRWPSFEFSAIVDGSTLRERFLAPGPQLRVDDPASERLIREALTAVLANRPGWWIGAKDDTLTMLRSREQSMSMRMFVPNDEIDRFFDEAVEIERGLRRVATRP
ncbi:MAG TPA: hypothetical protein VLV78_03870 [Thermoanaerobaculia bacterium]|nr:hypothetical protein [Thermoanaerobaculia bacterium]